MTENQIVSIATACHEVNRAWCEINGDGSQLPWDYSPKWQRESAIAGVMFKLDHPNTTPEDQHNEWCAFKKKDGWVHGDVKDAEKKTHTCLVPYNELPELQKVKDRLFKTLVEILSTNMGPIKSESTFGQKLVGYSFNPSKNPTVDKLKSLFAEAADTVNKEGISLGEHGDYLSIMNKDEALRSILTAQMWSVKHVTFKP